MARPRKKTLDYYPDDCNIEPEWEILSIKHGGIVYAIRSTLLKRIYGEGGYFLEWNDENALLHAGRFHIDYNLLTQVVSEALERGIFDDSMYRQHGILTSECIQDVYIMATLKRKNCGICEEYRLVFPKETEVCEEETPVFEAESTQIKEKEIKVKESKVNNTILKGEGEESKEKDCATSTVYTDPSTTPDKERYGKYGNVLLETGEYDNLRFEYPYIDLVIDRLSEYLEVSGKEYRNHEAVLSLWARQDREKYEKEQSELDAERFFALALKRSMEEMP